MDAPNTMGLIPGVSYVRIGPVKLEEIYLQDGRVLNGPRPGSNIVVKLLPGWTMVYDIRTDTFVPAETINPPQEVSFRLRATNSLELSDILALKKRLSEKSGVLIQDEAEKSGESSPEPVQPAVELGRAEFAANGPGDPGSEQSGAGPTGD